MRVALAITMVILTLGLTSRPMHGQMPAVDAVALVTIDMIDGQVGWAVADLSSDVRLLLRTTDGGTHWRDVTPMSSSRQKIRVSQIAALSSDTAWVPRVAGTIDATTTEIFRTIDGGRTWRSAVIQAQGVQSIHFIDTRNGWLLDGEGSYAGGNAPAIHHSTDGGETWVKISSTEPRAWNRIILFGGYKRAVTFLNVATGWVTGYDIQPTVPPIFVTHDGGRTWQPQKLPLPSGMASWVSGTLPPKFFTARDGVAPVFYTRIDASYTPLGSIVVFYATNNGGMTWTLTTPVSVTRVPTPVNFVDSNHGWVAEGDALHVTSDGGRQWRTVRPSPPFAVVRNLDFISPQVGWAVRETFPFLLKTVNGGRTWVPATYMISR